MLNSNLPQQIFAISTSFLISRFCHPSSRRRALKAMSHLLESSTYDSSTPITRPQTIFTTVLEAAARTYFSAGDRPRYRVVIVQTTTLEFPVKIWCIQQIQRPSFRCRVVSPSAGSAFPPLFQGLEDFSPQFVGFTKGVC